MGVIAALISMGPGALAHDLTVDKRVNRLKVYDVLWYPNTLNFEIVVTNVHPSSPSDLLTVSDPFLERHGWTPVPPPPQSLPVGGTLTYSFAVPVPDQTTCEALIADSMPGPLVPPTTGRNRVDVTFLEGAAGSEAAFRCHPPNCNVGEGDTTAAYNAIPIGSIACPPTTSFPFNSDYINEIGDEVELAGTDTELASLTVELASYACQSGRYANGDCASAPGATFDYPLTARIYEVADCAGTPCAGALITSSTQTVTFPYRPSADPVNCTGDDAGKFLSPDSGTCMNSVINLQTLTFPGGAVPANRRVIWTVSMNTQRGGYPPVGTAACTDSSGGCPYDLINLGGTSYPNAPYAGIDVDPDALVQSTHTPPPVPAAVPGYTDYRPLGMIRTK